MSFIVSFLYFLQLFYNTHTPQDSTTIKSLELEEVMVIENKSKIVMDNGEISIDLLAYIMNPNESALDVLRRIPGITINEMTREIRYHDKPIRFKLN